MKIIHVAAAIIQDGGRILTTQRAHGEYSGYWEFPGGKLEPGETAQEALVREIYEELDAQIQILRHFYTLEYDYPTFHLVMDCYLCRLENNDFTLLEHSAARWVTESELDDVDWLPADLEIIQALHAYMKTNPVKMIFFDIDGTLITNKTQILPDSVRQALAEARQNGHLTFINTGRTYFNIEQELRDLGFDGYLCGCGTYLYYHNTLLFSHTIPHETCVELLKLLRECGVSAFFEENGHIYKDPRLPSLPRLEKKMMDFLIKRGIPCHVFEDDSTATFDKFIVYFLPGCDKERFLRAIHDKLTYIDRGQNMGEIIQKNYSKATAIQYMMDYLHIPLENCYAIGDSTNDLSMLKFVSHAIAMGNSMPEILPYCSYQTSDVLEDGIYQALKHYHII
ncbi:MAG: Cof-type HAD-IIB family hydrolase [Lachnospiraceae bacterium]|jgi:Cof subfamily protein (haloacid dehalogenase superfamily)/mutator protein MutT